MTRSTLLVPALLAALAASPVSGVQQPPRRARATAATPAERPVPFAVGETLVYDVAYSSFVTAGTATLSVAQKKPSGGSAAYYITAEGRPTPFLSRLYPVYYKVDTLLDAFTLLPQRGSVYSDERGRRRTKIIRFDQRGRTAEYEVQGRRPATTTVPLDGDTQDALSVIYALRALPLADRFETTLHVLDAGEKYQVRVKVDGRDQIESAIGRLAAWRVVPTATDRSGRPLARGLAVWLTADRRRVPLRMEAGLPIGTFAFVLREMR
jgi:hypothetical protein